ncbi:hypothetical protein EVJ58_g3145 [Rhodofomes roseus]|uniref:F-box domain-containing protein n=1 Tax=Rhodofomes roseus TaxID=34475 RepID=A0A4Y9YMI1_9APHY|nr:hypothetical protein EVJ58_g3145 [Rhodofomes roseus]
MVVGFQSLNDDVLILIIALIPRSDMQNLALTSRTVSPVARRRILYSLRLNAPVKNLEFHNFMLEEDDGQRIQYLRKLTIICSKSPWRHKSADIYSPLATVLARAQNLRALVVSELEEQLAMEGGSVLGDAIASMRRLRELELRCVATRVRLEALSPFSIPNSRAQVQPATLVGLEILRNASEITLHNFQLRCNDTLYSLENMDPVALAPLYPNLAYLQMAFWQADDGGRGTRYGRDNHYTRTAEFTDDVHVASHLRVLDIYVHQVPPQDECLPLFSDSDLLCIRLRLVDQIDRVIDANQWLMMRMSCGYMVKNDVAPAGSSFRGEAQWWRVVGDDKGSGSRSAEADEEEEDSGDAESGKGEELVEIDEGEGERIDEYLRSEAFAETLKLY